MYHRRQENAANAKSTSKFGNDMKTKRNYINPAVIEGTMRVLQEYWVQHPKAQTPMIDFVNGQKIDASERARFVRAAKRLGMNVTRSQGKIYENGVLAWTV